MSVSIEGKAIAENEEESKAMKFFIILKIREDTISTYYSKYYIKKRRIHRMERINFS